MAKVLISTRGKKFGKCNICGSEGKLTEDHTPPKGCIKISQVELQHITSHLSLETPSGRGRLLQNGVRYRTLCHSCNNTYLGTKYDPPFIDFVNTVGSYLKTELYLPTSIDTEIEPQKIMRALLGHLSAQGVDRYDKGKDTLPIKNYFLDKSLPLPDFIRIYYWAFPFNNHVMVRDCSYLDLRANTPFIIWFVKFFPIAFMVTFRQPDEITLNLSELSRWRNEPIDFKAVEKVRLRNLPPQFWPEAPSDMNLIMYGQEAIVSSRYKNKTKTLTRKSSGRRYRLRR